MSREPTAAPTAADTSRFSTPRPRQLWVFLVTVVAIVAAAAVIRQVVRSWDEASNIARFHGDLDRLKARQTNSLWLHGSRGTESLPKKIRGMPEIENVTLEDGDATDEVLQHVATLPGLKHLIVYGYGHVPGVSDRGLAALRNCSRLERIELYGTSVTDAGVADLKQALPNVSVEK